MCLRTLLPLLGLLLLWPTTSDAQVRGRPFSHQALRHIGLEIMWQSQVAVDRGSGSVVAVTPDVSEDNAFTVVEVEHALGSTAFTDRQLDAFGVPLGVNGATREATEFIERLEQRGEKGTIKDFTVPEISLYAQTSAGILHAIDAETGRTRWRISAGRREYPSLAPAVHGQYAAVVNGASIFVMDVLSGRLLWKKSLFSGPGAPPAMSDQHVFVPMSNGMLETFDLANTPRAPSRTAAAGYATGRPTVTPQSVSWGTSRGHLYVKDIASPEMRFRLETSDAIVGQAIFHPPNHLIAVSRDGYVYSVHELHGLLNWRCSTGEPVSEQAVLVGDGLYVVTERRGMYRLSAETGAEQWRADHIARFISSSGERLYCLGDAHQLVVLDAHSGGRIASVPLTTMDSIVTQGLTDRLYLGTASGYMICLREPQNRWPIIHRRLAEPESPPKEGEEETSSESGSDANVFEDDGSDQPPADDWGEPPGGVDPADPMEDDPFAEDPFE